jgi:hypothetical protein
MTGPTKILTVSYGTFSCTLEGFDDPLGSMREMAEYFRDLAADDRYFGAEPPTPDVEMLQRIAEKEVQRRVEARVTDSGVALVAAAPSAAQTEKARTERAQSQPSAARQQAIDDAGTGPLAFDDDYLMSDEPEDAFSVDPDAHFDAARPAESVAEKLRRIRAVVTRNIEVDRNAAMREQTPNAGNPHLRARALTDTINQIQADLADDEDDDTISSSDDDTMSAVARVVGEAAEQSYEAEDEPQDSAPVEEDWDFEPELLSEPSEAEDAPSERSVTEMLGSVSERVASETIAVDDEDEVTPAPAQAERVTTRTLSPEPEADVGRLLNETDSKLNEDETVRRRRVISQMRAAVAATKAERMVSNHASREATEEAEKSLYKEDLSEAVEDAPREERRQRTSSPPLVLVSSQRIDSEPVPNASGAADFAARFGAKELPELMEAAAAFAIFSEGQPSFTRPEIMQMVTRMDPSLQLSREESLRSFGQLLREGKFKKLERGQFTIDHGTKYNPEQRAAGV